MRRRQFLRASTAMGAALAATGQSRQSTARGAAILAKRYRVGVIGRTGRGGYGHNTDGAWLDIPNCRIVGVADDDPAGLAAAAKRLNGARAFTDYRELLDKAKPDIVCIGSRWVDQHRDMAVAAAQRGMHIYIEKPFCRTLAEADEIVAVCEKTGAKLAMALPTRYSPKLETVKRPIAEGAIGRVLEYRGRGKEDRRFQPENRPSDGSHRRPTIRGTRRLGEECGLVSLRASQASFPRRH